MVFFSSLVGDLHLFIGVVDGWCLFVFGFGMLNWWFVFFSPLVWGQYLFAGMVMAGICSTLILAWLVGGGICSPVVALYLLAGWVVGVSLPWFSHCCRFRSCVS